MVPKGASFASYEFRGFSNASDAAYTTVVCLCTVTATGDHAVRMIPAKTKVAPLRKISLPRLELCGAHLSTKQMKRIQGAFHLIVVVFSSRINAGQRAFYYRGVKVWNNLSRDLREITNAKVFKRSLINKMIRNMNDL